MPSCLSFRGRQETLIRVTRECSSIRERTTNHDPRCAHGTIFINNSILAVPSSGSRRDGEPTLGVTRIGDSIVPTVTWAHAVSARNHDPVMTRFVNGAWTPLESIASSEQDDRHPRIGQDEEGTLHAAWGRDVAERLNEEIFYANRSEGEASFSMEERVSRAGEFAFHPSIAALSSGDVYISYESERGEAAPRLIVAHRVQRERSSGYIFRHRVVARTSNELPADPELKSLNGKSLLLTWIASPSRIGFRIMSNGKWSAPNYAMVAEAETATDARDRLVSRVCAPGESAARFERNAEVH